MVANQGTQAVRVGGVVAAGAVEADADQVEQRPVNLFPPGRGVGDRPAEATPRGAHGGGEQPMEPPVDSSPQHAVETHDELQAQERPESGDDAGHGVGELAADQKRHPVRVFLAKFFGRLGDSVQVRQQRRLRQLGNVER
ncbi:hypothetical protein GCM10027089_58860 [Nocardia thraciensis]